MLFILAVIYKEVSEIFTFILKFIKIIKSIILDYIVL
jgi:hypothetical protein